MHKAERGWDKRKDNPRSKIVIFFYIIILFTKCIFFALLHYLMLQNILLMCFAFFQLNQYFVMKLFQ